MSEAIALLLYELESVGYEIGPGQTIDTRPHGSEIPHTIHIDTIDLEGFSHHALVSYVMLRARELDLEIRTWDKELTIGERDEIQSDIE